jgi:hypothetical protein
MRERAFSMKILLRRAKLIKIFHEHPTLTINEIGARLGVSRWTVWRDMRFLIAHECMSLEHDFSLTRVVETFEDLFGRFREAHSKEHSCEWCDARRKETGKNTIG